MCRFQFACGSASRSRLRRKETVTHFVLARIRGNPRPILRRLVSGNVTLVLMRASCQKTMFSSATDEWPTPQGLYNALRMEFAFTLDPCATHENAKCRRHFTRLEDGLKQDWSRDVVFMNPPYGRAIGHWVRKAFESAKEGAVVVCLLPARTDTRWWHEYVMRGEIRLLCGRITFAGAQSPAPFPSAIVVFRPPEFRLVGVGCDSLLVPRNLHH